MKKIFLMCGIAALIAGFISCKMQKKEAENTAEEEQATTVDALYSGITPCADCEGIQVLLRLSIDGTYELQQTYLGKDNEQFISFGDYTYDPETGLVNIGSSEEPVNYLLEEQSLTQLDREGNKIEGEHAAMYVLVKVDENLVNKYWKLTEVMGQAVGSPDGAKEAYITFGADNARVSGNYGCNDFSGEYELKPGGRIILKQLVATEKMCLEMETETKFKEALNVVDSYTVNGDTLILNRARMAPLARLEAVYNL